MKQTTLDLNGPILGFSTHPQNVTVNNAGIATFIGIATAYFTSQNPTNIFSSNTGIVTHRWYAAGIGVLFDGTNTTLGATLSGTATTTLTVSGATSDIQLFVSADYIPSAYQSSSPITAGTGRSTGNAINEILFSNTATLTVNSFISISVQPSSSTVAQGQTATFSVTAASSNNTDVAYQWYIGGSPVSNGTSGGNTISGANTNILTVTTSSSTPVEISNIFVSVSHPTAGNSPVVSNTVILVVILPRAILNLELLTTSTSTAILSNVNLETTSAFTYNATIFANRILCFYAPEKDINLELEIFASKGLDSGGYFGGQGGYSKIRFTVRKNEEYVITPLQLRTGGIIGPAFNVTGGSVQIVGLYTYHYFYNTGTYTITGNPSGYSFDWLLVAGGGAGGESTFSNPGGGGAGGMKTGTVSVASAGIRSFIVGDGGAAAVQAQSSPGSLSSAFLPDGTSVSVSGGGAGGGNFAAGSGGSGGGGRGFGFEPSLGISGEGNNGGRSAGASAGGGGGGKGSVGSNGEQNTRGGSGGQGESWVDGRFYAGGGGGGATTGGTSGGQGGIGGGGKGGDGNISGTSGSENASSATGGTGGGGGGYGYDFNQEDPGTPGNGGSGIFAIRYLTPLSQSNYSGSFFIYRKAALIAVVGAGGDSGNGGNGGNGGGINVSSASGSGRGAGGFNFAIPAGGLPSTGVFGSGATQEPYAGTGDTKASSSNGGRVLPCARGRYWRDLGYSACQDLGNIQFFTDSGVRVTNTATISRGYKIGYDIRQTSGAGLNGGGAGGQGAQGGQGGVNGGGGGGGNGYTDGSVTVVSTQQGGSTGDAKIIFRTF
jgi:hypothetical protein